MTVMMVMSISFSFSQNDSGLSLSLDVEVSAEALSHALGVEEGSLRPGDNPSEAKDSILQALQQEAVALLHEANQRLQLRLAGSALEFLREDQA